MDADRKSFCRAFNWLCQTIQVNNRLTNLCDGTFAGNSKTTSSKVEQ